ncbi:hypothetical protein PNOK_0661900 [Pyrrhoderma noxium]|uniref:Uncharacterized protein n=1 Tax=Pyrrhoderma noxium TaxID=2282107 RepID=A0A286UEV1_9AGAM|nr:hypothetical protein PNOK_0661900 [Pyrrhoderma noxium]
MSTYFNETYPNNSCLGLELGIDTTDIPSFEFPSVERMVASYQSSFIDSDYYLGNKNNNSEEAKKTDQVASQAEPLETEDGVHYMKPAMIREMEKEIDEMLTRLAAPFSTPDGVENSWHLTMEDDLDDWEFEALVWEIMNFSPFGNLDQ